MTSPEPEDALVTRVDERATRKLRARAHARRGIWNGLGTMGLIGWSVVAPTVGGALLGRWLDARGGGGHAKTLALLVAGLLVGCGTAWRWVVAEMAAIREEQDDDA